MPVVGFEAEAMPGGSRRVSPQPRDPDLRHRRAHSGWGTPPRPHHRLFPAGSRATTPAAIGPFQSSQVVRRKGRDQFLSETKGVLDALRGPDSDCAPFTSDG